MKLPTPTAACSPLPVAVSSAGKEPSWEDGPARHAAPQHCQGQRVHEGTVPGLGLPPPKDGRGPAACWAPAAPQALSAPQALPWWPAAGAGPREGRSCSPSPAAAAGLQRLQSKSVIEFKSTIKESLTWALCDFATNHFSMMGCGCCALKTYAGAYWHVEKFNPVH